MKMFTKFVCPLCGKLSKTFSDKLGHFNRFSRNIKWSRASFSTSSTGYSDSAHSKRKINLADFPIERIRNFSIIAHIDHGKSTLADRLLEITGTISDRTKNEQVLDKLQVERERGITVKAQTASLVYHYKGEDYLLNLIDTPGHVDFNYEVARSLAACQGVILLVDANQGVQAQTVANFYLAFEADLLVIPVINKIDLKIARPEEVSEQVQNIFDVEPQDVLKVSAKVGTGVEDVLKAVIDKVPHPPFDCDKPLQALLFDLSYDRYRGVVINLAIKAGIIKKGDEIWSVHKKKAYEVQEIGILHPDETPTDILYAGQVGYMYAMMKNVKEAVIGDTFCHANKPTDALPGFKPAKPMVFAGIFPMDQSEYSALKNSLDKLLLNDSSIQVNADSSAALGQGWRLGFLGLLHLEVFTQRLEQEYNTSVLITTPNVPYKVTIFGHKNIKFYGGEELTILNPSQMPDKSIITEMQEPFVNGTIITPDEYIGEIMSLLLERRGEQLDQTYIDNKRIMFKAVLPLNEIVVDFFDILKSLTSGYASFDYEDCGFRPSELVKIDVALNGQDVEELAQITHVSKARSSGKRIVNKLKTTIPQQMFEVAVQAKIGQRVVARENIKALRKDVLAKCYGGDISRKMKLLKRQSEGKKRMKRIGNIDVPKDTFIKVLQK